MQPGKDVQASKDPKDEKTVRGGVLYVF